MLLGGLLALAPGCAPMSFLVTPLPATRALTEFVVRRDSVWATDKVALVDVDGVITDDQGWSLLGLPGDNPVSVFADKLKKAGEDARVKAVVVRINSPGGGVTASETMYDELRRFRTKHRKPVIAAMVDVAASGGYYLACAADRIYATPTTVTGSIGVIMITPDLTGTMAKLGISTNVIKSGEMKDAGSPFRIMRPQEREMFQGMIDAMHEQFVQVVAKARKQMTEAQVRAVADGRVLLAEPARQVGLIDEVGTLREAIETARREAGLADRPILVVQYARPAAHKPNIYAAAPDGAAPQVNLVNIELPAWLRRPAPQFLYLWAPTW